jgi:NAD(P)-dependent dehydrogenase (short-subunit alcohol dehydrogenase family)
MKTFQDLANLRGRTALVTGANGLLGRVFCETLAELGANLILVDLPESDFETTKSSIIKNREIEVSCIPENLEDSSQRENLIRSIIESNIELNLLVNNAAFVGTSNLNGWNVSLENQSLDTWRRSMEVNLTAVFDLCKGLYPIMKGSTGANIVNIASIYGIYGPDWRLYEGTQMGNPAAYAVSKGGIIQLTRWLATTMAPNVRVNAISPGGVKNGQNSSFIKKYESRTPLERMATPQDMKGAIAFLASDLSEYVTGHILEVNGGWGIW